MVLLVKSMKKGMTMLCEICKQKQASIHIQEIADGEKKALHICTNCASKKGLNAANFQGINIAEILYKLSANPDQSLLNELNVNPQDADIEKTVAIVICQKCNWTSEQLQKTGKLGCEHCYKTFSEILTETLNNMHRGAVHTGKRPNTKASEQGKLMLDIISYQQKLDKHVLREEFEEAAKLRDKINNLKTNTKPSEDGK